MSDYFGALMRASGLAIAGAQRPHDVREVLPPAPQDAVVETDAVPAAHDPISVAAAAAAPDARTVVRSAAAPPAAQPPPVSIQHARAAAVAPSSPLAVPAQVSAPPGAPSPRALDGLHRDRRADDARVPAFPDTDPPPGTTPEADAAAPASASARSSPIRAALQWIAADPHSANPGNLPDRHAPQAGSVRAAPPGASSPADAAIVPHAVHLRDDAPPPRSAAIEAWLREPAIPPQASRHRREHDAAPGDPVEVSIGAIHVRVDAPAVQTRLAPAAPAAAPRAPNRPAARDAAARRLLRRI